TWGARIDNLEKPDRMIFDLDPDEHVPQARLIEAAQYLRSRIEEQGLQALLQTTGGKGFHVVVPLQRRRSWTDVRSLSRQIAEDLVRKDPNSYVVTASKAARKGKIFIDYLRNTRGATAIAPYSLRARLGATVATPITWKELESGIQPDEFT